MKKIMMIAALMVATLTASAQNEVGKITLQPKVGLNLSTVSGDFDDTKIKAGLVAGVEAEYGVTEALGISAGVLYSMQGTGVKNGDALKMDYINIPILAQYYVTDGLAVKAGVQPAFNVSHKWGNADVTNANSFDFSIPVGVSYQISDFVVDARYNFGLTKVLDSSLKAKNSVIQITVGYKFGL